MKVTVKLYYTLTKLSSNGSNTFEHGISMGEKVQDVLSRLEIPLEKVAIISVNSEIVTTESEVKQGDVIKLYPIVSGG